MKKALVTGAAGFIGSNVVRVLLEDGIDVRALVLPGEDQRNLSGIDVEKVEGNVLDVSSLDAALKGCDTLFHLAAIFAIWARDRSIFYKVNVEGVRNMLRSAKRAELEKIVFTSSIAGIGISPGQELSDEETEFNQFDGASDYILTKYLSQQEALAFAEEGLPLTVVNPCFPYGEGDVAPTPTGKIILDVANGMQIFCFDGGLNIVDVRDVAMGHLLAAKHGENGEMYILGNRNVTVKELFEMVARIAGLDVRYVSIPVPLTKAVAWMFETWADISGNPPISTPKEIAYSAQYLFFDISKAREKLGYQPGPVEDSLERAIEWYRREGYIPREGLLPVLIKGVGQFMNRLPF